MGRGPRVFSSDRNNDFLSTRKWGIGPTSLMLKQAKAVNFWFFGEQLWSFAGDENRSEPDVSSTFFRKELEKRTRDQY